MRKTNKQSSTPATGLAAAPSVERIWVDAERWRELLRELQVANELPHDQAKALCAHIAFLDAIPAVRESALTDPLRQLLAALPDLLRLAACWNQLTAELLVPGETDEATPELACAQLRALLKFVRSVAGEQIDTLLVPLADDLTHDAECWREMRRLNAAAAEALEQPKSDALAICCETLDGVYQLLDADGARTLDRTAAAFQARKPLSRPHLEHAAREAMRGANRITRVITLVEAALAEGAAGRWPATLFPEQKRNRADAHFDGNFATIRDYLAAELEYANHLKCFSSLKEAAELLAKEANALGGVAGKRVTGAQIMDWRWQRKHKVKSAEDSIDATAYGGVLAALLARPEQPQTKAAASSVLRALVGACSAIDPRRAAEKH